MKIKILIADDHHVVRKGLVFFLQTQPDLEVVGEASNGEEAIKLATSLEPHIVLMDLSMPVLDGIEATKELKTSTAYTSHDSNKLFRSRSRDTGIRSRSFRLSAKRKRSR